MFSRRQQRPGLNGFDTISSTGQVLLVGRVWSSGSCLFHSCFSYLDNDDFAKLTYLDSIVIQSKMEAFGLAASALQIVGFCASTTQMIVRWGIDVRTADERIRGFYDEITTLETTYIEVRNCLESPISRNIAMASYKTTDGHRLWNGVRDALNDSYATMTKVRAVLDKIDKSSGILRRPKVVFQESVRSGELGHLRERLKYFNSTIALSIQMVVVMTQQEQRGMTQDIQRTLDVRFHELERTLSEVLHRLESPSSASDLRGATLVVGSVDDPNPAGKDNYLSFAKRFITSASAVASTRSNLSTISPPIDPTPRYQPRATTNGNTPADRRHTIAQWASDVNASEEQIGQSENANALEQARRRTQERECKLAQSYLHNGQKTAKAGTHESAEKNFKKALDILAKYDLSGRISFHPAEVILMLAEACLKQQKLDECINLLKPVASQENNIFPPACNAVEEILPVYQADHLQALAAAHLLGEVYRQKGEWTDAKFHALRAFDERTDLLGEADEKTLDSARLCIKIYREMGDEETADAYMVFLDVETPPSRQESINEDFHSEAPTMITVPTASPPASEIHILPDRTVETSTTSRIRGMFGPRRSNSNMPDPVIRNDQHRHSFGRMQTGLSGSSDPATPFEPSSPNLLTQRDSANLSPPQRIRTESDAGRASTRDRRSSSIDESASIETIFRCISDLAREGKKREAAKLGLKVLKKYDLNSWPTREFHLKENIQRGTSKAQGLASTGKGYSPIHLFSEVPRDCVEEVALLIRDGVDINTGCYQAGLVSGEVFTPIQLAISKHNTGVAKLLIKQPSIKLDMQDRNDLTPLLAAARKGNAEVVAAILDKPGLVPKSYPKEWYGNLLMDSARHCRLAVVELLLVRNIFDVNQQDKFLKTALHYAIIKTDVPSGAEKERMLNTRLAVVRKLIDHGADITVMDQRGYTAVDYAQIEGDGRLIAAVSAPRFELADTPA